MAKRQLLLPRKRAPELGIGVSPAGGAAGPSATRTTASCVACRVNKVRTGYQNRRSLPQNRRQKTVTFQLDDWSGRQDSNLPQPVEILKGDSDRPPRRGRTMPQSLKNFQPDNGAILKPWAVPPRRRTHSASRRAGGAP